MSLEFDQEQGLFRVTLTGCVDIVRSLQISEQILKHPNFRPGMPALWDCRNADLSSLTFANFQKLRAFQAERILIRGNARVALVVSDELSFGLGRMLQQVADLPNIEFNVFRDFRPAERWVLDKDDAD
jgi:hypothetical protein